MGRLQIVTSLGEGNFGRIEMVHVDQKGTPRPKLDHLDEKLPDPNDRQEYFAKTNWVETAVTFRHENFYSLICYEETL